jgi:hypothetical protein
MMIDRVDDFDGLIVVTHPLRTAIPEHPAMNRFFTNQQVISEYGLSTRLHVELFRAVQPVDHDGQTEPLYLEDHLDRWLADRFGAGRDATSATPVSSQERRS